MALGDGKVRGRASDWRKGVPFALGFGMVSWGCGPASLSPAGSADTADTADTADAGVPVDAARSDGSARIDGRGAIGDTVSGGDSGAKAVGAGRGTGEQDGAPGG